MEPNQIEPNQKKKEMNNVDIIIIINVISCLVSVSVYMATTEFDITEFVVTEFDVFTNIHTKREKKKEY